jgi:zinc-ribbon domain
MTDDDWEADDEDWYDEEDDLEDQAAVACPECGAPIYADADKCPACGYWLLEADRRAAGSGESRPAWIQLTAGLMLLAILAVVFLTLLAAF